MKKSPISLLAASFLLAFSSCGNNPSKPVKNTYTVSFNSHGGSPVADLVDVSVVEESPDTTRSGYDFEASMSVVKVTHGDAWPKMGIVVKSGDKMLFYYIDMFASLTGKKVGYAYHYNMPGHWGSDFDWDNKKESSDLDYIHYIYNQYTSLKVVYINGNLELYVDNNKIFDVTNPFGGEGAYFGLLSFNASFKTNSIVVE